MYRDKAIILTGPSGSGKSETLNFLQKHFKIISDDIVAVTNINNQMMCYTGLPFLCVKQDQELLTLDDKRQRSLKLIKESNMTTRGYEISKIFYLKWGKNNTIEKIKNIVSFKHLLSNCFRPLPSADCKESETLLLKYITKIISSTDQFIYKRRIGSIEDSGQFLIRLLDDIT